MGFSVVNSLTQYPLGGGTPPLRKRALCKTFLDGQIDELVEFLLPSLDGDQ